MLEIKSRHLSWGGPYSIGKVWDKEQMSLHMLLYQILPTNINYQFDEIIAGLELEKWCVSVKTRLFHFEYWLGTLILVMGPAQKSQARLGGPWIWMLGSGRGLSLSPSEKFKHKPWLHNCFNYLGSKWCQPHQVLQKSSFRALTHHYIPNLRSNRTLLLYFRFHFRQYPFHLRQGRLWKIAIFLIQSHEAESRWNLLTTSHTVCQTIKYSAKQKTIT